MGTVSASAPRQRLPVLQGILPIDRGKLSGDVVAGVTLAALGIPEVMGYTKIAGMPVITGLYTILIPILVYALLGSSRHLVVGADSATAAIMAAGMAGLAPIASPQYVEMAGILAIMTAGFLLLARLLKLGFLANFLSRSVLIGFLTGVGIQVAMGQVSGMFGVDEGTGFGPIVKFFRTLGNIPDASWATFGVTAAVLVIIFGLKKVNPKIPGGLVAVIGTIAASWAFDLESHGISVLGSVPSGLPSFGIPRNGWGEWETLLPVAGAIFIVILAQSAATSRSYAARYNEKFDENVDLVGLSGANLASGFSGAFVVNGSPTKTQIVDGAGGRSQVASISASVVVLIVLLFLTKPLQYLPNAVLATIVFVIGVELIDIAGMRKILNLRVNEFVIASITAAVVVIWGVEQAIILAMVLSIIDHLRFGYRPRNTFLTIDSQGRWQGTQVSATEPPVSAVPGLLIYRFSASLYYANSNLLEEEIHRIITDDAPPKWLCIDAIEIGDVDFTGSEVLAGLIKEAQENGVRLVFAELPEALRKELSHDDDNEHVGDVAFFETVQDVVDAYTKSGNQPETRVVSQHPVAGEPSGTA